METQHMSAYDVPILTITDNKMYMLTCCYVASASHVMTFKKYDSRKVMFNNLYSCS